MCNKLISFACVVLVLFLASSTYGLVIGNWEDSNDGWDIWGGPDPAPPGTTIDYNDTIGVTLDSNSLKLYVPQGGTQRVLYIQLDDEGLVEEFFDNAIFAMDVTRIADEWSSDGGFAGIDLIVNASSDSGDVFQTLGGTLFWSPPDGDSTKMATWDYSETKSLIDPDSISWLEFIIVTNYDPNFTSPGNYYLDNAQLLTKVYETVIGNWEDANDGWIDWGNQKLVDDPDNMPSKYTYSTDWSSLDSNSLKLTHSGWNQNLSIKLQDAGHVADFMDNTKFLIDLHAPATTESGWLKIEEIVLNAEGANWGDYKVSEPAFIGWGGGGGGARDVTLEFDYSAYLSDPDFLALGRNPYWVEFIIATNNDGVHTTFYFDNARLAGGPKATDPKPDNEATDIETNPVLRWTPGYLVNTHEVYIGTDFNDVNDATPDNHLNVDFNTVDVNRYEPGILESNTTYFWRVDEVKYSDSWKGDVWQFTTGSHLVVDDMDDYGDDPNVPWTPGSRIYYVWRDGWDITEPVTLPGNLTGSQVYYWWDTEADFMESTIVHSPPYSMPYYYENDGDTDSKPMPINPPYPNPDNDDMMEYSEASAKTVGPNSLNFTEDWTTKDVKVLVLWFYGDPNNDANTTEQMYVALEDGDNPSHLAVVPYNGDMNDIKEEQWHEWDIALSEFTDVNLANVQKLYIGFGNREEPASGGKGIVYFDDIQLYPSICILSERSADFAKADYAPASYSESGDCVIDYQELEIMIRDWLAEDDIVTPTQNPGTTNLVAYYPMDEGQGTNVDDASVNDHNGTFSESGVTWTSSGVMDTQAAIHVDGSAGSRISIGNWDPVGTNGLTLSAWVKWAGPKDDPGGQPQGIICKRDGWDIDELQFTFEMDTPGTNGSLAFRQIDSESDVYTAPGTMLPFIGEWAHIGATYNGTIATIYLNGRAIGSGSFTPGNGTDSGMVIGNVNSDAWPNCPGSFYGDIDEVQIYNRAMMTEEVAYLADPTPGDNEHHVPVPSPAEIYEGEAEGSRKVNFRDFAILTTMWLEEELSLKQ